MRNENEWSDPICINVPPCPLLTRKNATLTKNFVYKLERVSLQAMSICQLSFQALISLLALHTLNDVM